MDIRGESPGNPLNNWIGSLVFPVLNGVVILSLFPAPIKFIGDLIETALQRSQAAETVSMLSACQKAASTPAGTSTAPPAEAFDICDAINVADKFIQGEVSAILSSVSFFGFLIIGVLLIAFHMLTRLFIALALGASDIRDDRLEEHGDIAGDPAISAVLEEKQKQTPSQDAPEARADEEKSQPDSSSGGADFNAAWAYVKVDLDLRDNLALYHRRRDAIVVQMSNWRGGATFFVSYSLVSFLVFAFALLCDVSDVTLFTLSAGEEKNADVPQNYFIFGVAFALLWLLCASRYLAACVDLAKLDFATYRHAAATDPEAKPVAQAFSKTAAIGETKGWTGARLAPPILKFVTPLSGGAAGYLVRLIKRGF